MYHLSAKILNLHTSPGLETRLLVLIIDDDLLQFLEFVERSCEHADNTAFHLPLKICFSDKGLTEF